MQYNAKKFSMSSLHFKLDWRKVDSCMTIMKRNIKVHFLYLLIHTGLSESKWCIGVKCHMIRDYPAYNRVSVENSFGFHKKFNRGGAIRVRTLLSQRSPGPFGWGWPTRFSFGLHNRADKKIHRYMFNQGR